MGKLFQQIKHGEKHRFLMLKSHDRDKHFEIKSIQEIHDIDR